MFGTLSLYTFKKFESSQSFVGMGQDSVIVWKQKEQYFCRLKFGQPPKIPVIFLYK